MVKPSPKTFNEIAPANYDGHPFRKMLLTAGKSTYTKVYRPLYYTSDQEYGEVDMRGVVIYAGSLCEAYVKFADFINESCRFPYPCDYFESLHEMMTDSLDDDETLTVDNVEEAVKNHNENDTLWLMNFDKLIVL